MENILVRLRQDYPSLTFSPGSVLCWSPKQKEIMYESNNVAGLLHELAHALLGHDSYTSDMTLLKKETEAWEAAKQLGHTYQHEISDEHIQDCLDTYRDWLHKRSRCPTCAAQSLQTGSNEYTCVNCKSVWSVSSARFCRTYRRSKVRSAI